jgi:hypothetical protein
VPYSVPNPESCGSLEGGGSDVLRRLDDFLDAGAGFESLSPRLVSIGSGWMGIMTSAGDAF